MHVTKNKYRCGLRYQQEEILVHLCMFFLHQRDRNLQLMFSVNFSQLSDFSEHCCWQKVIGKYWNFKVNSSDLKSRHQFFTEATQYCALLEKRATLYWDVLHGLSGVTKNTAFPVRCRLYLYVECDIQGLKTLLQAEYETVTTMLFCLQKVGWLICLAVLIVQY